MCSLFLYVHTSTNAQQCKHYFGLHCCFFCYTARLALCRLRCTATWLRERTRLRLAKPQPTPMRLLTSAASTRVAATRRRLLQRKRVKRQRAASVGQRAAASFVLMLCMCMCVCMCVCALLLFNLRIIACCAALSTAHYAWQQRKLYACAAAMQCAKLVFCCHVRSLLCQRACLLC